MRAGSLSLAALAPSLSMLVMALLGTRDQTASCIKMSWGSLAGVLGGAAEPFLPGRFASGILDGLTVACHWLSPGGCCCGGHQGAGVCRGGDLEVFEESHFLPDTAFFSVNVHTQGL